MIETASLFCGGGGEMLAKQLAFQDLGITEYHTLAVNHWDIAVAASRANFPDYRVEKHDLTQVNADDFNVRRLDLLWASPSCTHFSVAAGGVPRSEQQRSHADEVIDRWLARCDVGVFLLENVPEFKTWCRILRRGLTYKGCRYKAGQPDPRHKGEYFDRFVKRLQALGYTVEHRVLNAADYGDPTKRKRFFLQAVKDGRPISWPAPTHIKADSAPGRRRWVAASTIIDWNNPGQSIFTRKKALLKNTLNRLKYGLVNFGLKPYLQHMSHSKSVQQSSMDAPVPTVTTARGGELGLVQPYVTEFKKGMPAAGVDAPLSTALTREHHGLAQPYLCVLRNNQHAASTHDPLSTVTTFGHHGLVQPCIIKQYGGGCTTPASDIRLPLPTVTCQDHNSVMLPWIVKYFGTGKAVSVEEPCPTVTTRGRYGLAQLVLRYGNDFSRFPVVRTAADVMALTLETPFFIETPDGLALVDILFRMLTPRELASAMGFPSWYRFTHPDGRPLTQEQSVKLVGNACPVNTVRALIRNIMEARPDLYQRKAA